MYQVDNAIIMAAGTSSRFAPLSYERPKGLIEVRGEVLIERQIRQLHEAGIRDVVLVTGYKKEEFAYLKDKFGVTLVDNPWYNTRNNNASIQAARNYLRNSYLCSSDNYFSANPFEKQVKDSYYAAVYADGKTNEWCLTEDADGRITGVTVGGRDAWYMLGHTFWSEDFSRRFLKILDAEYDLPETAGKLWETIYMDHLDELSMTARHYPADVIFEFDTLDELRMFDASYRGDTRSRILKEIAAKLGCQEAEMTGLTAQKKTNNSASGFTFTVKNCRYEYEYESRSLAKVTDETN